MGDRAFWGDEIDHCNFEDHAGTIEGEDCERSLSGFSSTPDTGDRQEQRGNGF